MNETKLDIPGRDITAVSHGPMGADMSNVVVLVERIQTGPGTPYFAFPRGSLGEEAPPAYRAPVRRTPHGAEPWDLAAGDAS